MNQVQANKYSIAWFKLAECVSRREKERALGVYRLLAHSFDNRALACQLEADIMLAFNERESAIAKYTQAAQLYEKQGEPMQAIAVYDHIITLQGSSDQITKMIEIAAQMDDVQHGFSYLKRLSRYLIKRGDFEQLIPMVQASGMSFYQKSAFLMKVTFMVLEDITIDRQTKLQLINQMVSFLIIDPYQLQQFLTRLKTCNDEAYLYACACLEQ